MDRFGTTTLNGPESDVVEIFFHCHMSLIRGPSSASHVQDLIKMNRDLRVKIHLIEGGWKNWMREHPDLIETDRKISGC